MKPVEPREFFTIIAFAIATVLMFIFSSEGRADPVTDFRVGSFSTKLEWNQTKMHPTEKAWMVLHVIDALQTANHGKDPCYGESDPITRRLIGRNPNDGEVLAWAIGAAVFEHYSWQFVNNSNLPSWIKKVHNFGKLYIKADVVHNNYQVGINLYGDNSHYRSGNPATIACAKYHGL